MIVRGLGSPWKLWLPAGAIAMACVVVFTGLCIATTVGQEAFSILRFVLGSQHITARQRQLVHAVTTAFPARGMSVEMHLRERAMPQRRGRESWQRQQHTVQLPSGVSLQQGATVVRNVTHDLRYTVLGHQPRPSAIAASVAITIGIAGVPTDTFVLQETPSVAPIMRHKAQIAIVIDDLGWDLKAARALLALRTPLSFAILPDTPYRTIIAQEVQRHGWDVLLHLPMEPYHYPDVNPGKSALLSTMNARELARQIGVALEALPTAVGVNNHMGSRLTENRYAMQAVMHHLKGRNLFFLDSRTTHRSLAFQIAQEIGVPSAQRQVFLDHQVDLEQIQLQLRHLVSLASLHGSAIGIGHPYPETVQALQAFLPEVRRGSVDLVPVSRLVK